MLSVLKNPAPAPINKLPSQERLHTLRRRQKFDTESSGLLPNSDSALLTHLSFPFLRACSRSERQVLRDRLVFKRVSKKTFVYLPYTSDSNIYFVIHGNIELGYLDESGREISIDILAAGDIFGSFMRHDGAENRLTGGFSRAVGKTLLAELHKDDFDYLMEQSAHFSQEVLKTLRQRVFLLEQKLQQLVFNDVKTRICKLLNGLFEKIGDPASGTIKIQLTHQDIANLVASSRETASLHLSELKKSGVIEYDRKFIRILSPGRLLEQSAGH